PCDNEMHQGNNHRYHRPGRPEQMRKTDNRTNDKKNVAHYTERQRRDDATNQYQQLHRSRFGFLRKQNKPALKKLYDRADQSQRVVDQTGMARRIARSRALVAHFRELLDLTPEDQTQYEPNSQRREYRLCLIFAHVLLCIVLKGTDATPGVSPCLFCFTACVAPSLLCLASVFVRKSACG